MRKLIGPTVLGLVLALVTRLELEAALVQVSPTADTRLLTFYPNDALGKDVYLSVYNNIDDDRPNIQHTLIHFDMSVVPSGQLLNSASLTLNLYTWGENPGQPMEIYRVTKPWTESGATWNSSGIGAWTTPGGDYVGTGSDGTSPYAVTSTQNPVGQDYVSAVTWDITDLAREWYTGGQQNYGLLLLSHLGNRMHFGSKENNEVPIPTLSINYTPVPEPSTILAGLLLCVPFGVKGIRFLRNRN